MAPLPQAFRVEVPWVPGRTAFPSLIFSLFLFHSVLLFYLASSQASPPTSLVGCHFRVAFTFQPRWGLVVTGTSWWLKGWHPCLHCFCLMFRVSLPGLDAPCLHCQGLQRLLSLWGRHVVQGQKGSAFTFSAIFLFLVSRLLLFPLPCGC